MIVLTREQRVALKRVYDRCPLYIAPNGTMLTSNQGSAKRALTYREFRGFVQDGYDCVMVPWCGMWLGIETDGYTHS